jgi:hypothetical protein
MNRNTLTALLPLFLVLLTATQVYGQPTVTVSPPNPVAWQAITFYFRYNPFSTNFLLVSSLPSCPAGTASSLIKVPKNTIMYDSATTDPSGVQADYLGAFTITISSGLAAGPYIVILYSFNGAMQFNGGWLTFTSESSICNTLTVLPN